MPDGAGYSVNMHSIFVFPQNEPQSRLVPKLEITGLRRSSLRPPPSSGHRGSRTPTLGSRPLPCSPLVVHFKRHMVPSLRLEKQELLVKTKAEMKAEAMLSPETYPAPPHTPSSSPTTTPSPAPPTFADVQSKVGCVGIECLRKKAGPQNPSFNLWR